MYQLSEWQTKCEWEKRRYIIRNPFSLHSFPTSCLYLFHLIRHAVTEGIGVGGEWCGRDTRGRSFPTLRLTSPPFISTTSGAEGVGREERTEWETSVARVAGKVVWWGDMHSLGSFSHLYPSYRLTPPVPLSLLTPFTRYTPFLSLISFVPRSGPYGMNEEKSVGRSGEGSEMKGRDEVNVVRYACPVSLIVVCRTLTSSPVVTTGLTSLTLCFNRLLTTLDDLRKFNHKGMV